MSKPAKDIRNQVRNVAKEMLEEELSIKIYEKILKQMNTRMDLIADNAKDTLTKIDERSKSVQDYVLRMMTKFPGEKE